VQFGLELYVLHVLVLFSFVSFLSEAARTLPETKRYLLVRLHGFSDKDVLTELHLALVRIMGEAYAFDLVLLGFTFFYAHSYLISIVN
jgi:hypothetical protein